jgi:hypothetical protein
MKKWYAKLLGVVCAAATITNASIIISEIYYHPSAYGLLDGDEYEFLELKNTGTAAVSLNGYSFTSGITYAFPAGTTLEPGAFFVLACNQTNFLTRYGKNANGVYTGKLNNAGEKIELRDTVTNIKVLSVSYSTVSPWPTAADGAGFSLVPVNAAGTGDANTAAYWRTSSLKDGSPGKDDTALAVNILPILINEVLTHTDLPDVDAIELHNPNSSDVDISGWYLTDNIAKPAKFKIPAGSVVKAKEYMVFDAGDFNADSTDTNSFNLSAHGDGAYIYSADNQGVLTGYAHGYEYGEIDNKISFGYHVNSVGEAQFTAMESVTLGKQNSGPKIGPLVFSQICYNAAGDADYVIISNISNAIVLLYDQAYPLNTWKINGLGFSFPPNMSINPGENIVVVSDTVTADLFRSSFNVAATIQVFTFPSKLSSSGETITLQKPCEPYTDGAQTVVPFMNIDGVKFNDKTPWPVCPQNYALIKKDLTLYGNDPASWKTAAANPSSKVLPFTFKNRFGIVNDMSFNPKTNSVHLDLLGDTKVAINLYDLRGRVVFSYSADLRRGVYNIPVNLCTRTSGTYIVTSKIGNNQKSTASMKISMYK